MKTSDTYSLCEHASKFGTYQMCHDYLVNVRWNGKPQCPHCKNSNMNYYLSTRKTYKCSSCRKQFSITRGTIFENSKIPLQKWFLCIYIFTTYKRSISSCQMAKVLGISQQSAWLMMHKLREALKNENEIILYGVVEADESFIGPKINRDLRLQMKRKQHNAEQEAIHGMGDKKRIRVEGGKRIRGRKKGETNEMIAQNKLAKKALGKRVPFERGYVILGMVEQRGRFVMKTLGKSSRDVTRENIYPLLQKHISSSAILITDQLNLYDNTNTLFAAHKTVNHQIGYVVDGISTNNVENSWKHLKKLIDGTYFHISYKHIDRYLDENTYRWNRRNESLQFLFDDFMKLTFCEAISYNELTQEDEKIAA